MKRTTKILSLLLTGMLLFNSMVFTVVSEEAYPSETETASEVVLSDVIEEKYDAGDEIVEWREEGVKHYYLGDGQYQAVVKPDKEVLQKKSQQAAAKSSITVRSSGMPLDTHISYSAQSTNYGDVDGVRVSTVAIGLIYLSDVSLPVNSNILFSSLNFAYYYNVSDGYLTVGAYAIEEYWDEYEVTWDDMEIYPNMGISTISSGTTTLTASSTCNVNNPTWAAVDITDIVRSWYSGERYNEGIALKRIGGNNNSVIIKSYESEQEAYFPYYTITYTLLDEDVIPRGEYYLKNEQFDKFAEIDDNASSTAEGASTEIWKFNADNDQRWNIVYLYNGYYKITSTASGKALTAPTSTESPITQKTYTGSTSQHWIIVKNANGSYKISPRTNDSYFISAGSGSISESGRSIQLRVSQSDARDDWSFILVSEYIHWSCNTRIYYDATVLYSEAYMKTAYERATAAFIEKFNFQFKSPTIAYSSLLDVSTECSHAQTSTATCTQLCGDVTSCRELHHKSSPRLNTLLTSNYCFTYRLVGYALCMYYDGEHISVVGSGNVDGKNATTSTLTSPNLVASIQHELTHNLGRVDHCTDNGQLCIFQGDVGYWCDDCAQYIMDNY